MSLEAQFVGVDLIQSNVVVGAERLERPSSYRSVEWSEMSVSLELQNTGNPSIEPEVRALVEHALIDRPGDWRVSIVGSRETDGWEMKVLGPNGFERTIHWWEMQESTRH